MVYLLRAPLDAAAGAALRDDLLGEVAPALLAEREVHAVTVLVHDPEAAEAPSPAPAPPGEAVHVAQVSVWVDCYQRRPTVAVDGYDVAAHLVVESLYEDRQQTWPDGERSPGVVTVAAIHRPEALPEAQWLHNWHEVQSPGSARLQPRLRYVRNRVVQTLDPAAPVVDGIVEETWASPEVIADPDLFFNGGGDPEVVRRHVEEMMANVVACLDLEKLRSTTMSEFIVRALG